MAGQKLIEVRQGKKYEDENRWKCYRRDRGGAAKGFRELKISDKVAERLKGISLATMDRKLRLYEEALRH